MQDQAETQPAPIDVLSSLIIWTIILVIMVGLFSPWPIIGFIAAVTLSVVMPKKVVPLIEARCNRQHE